MTDERRSTGMGGGDVGRLVTGYGYELWEQKTGRDVMVVTPQMQRGTRLEPYVRDMYVDETGALVTGPVLVVGDEPWMHGHLDGYLIHQEEDEAGSLIEYPQAVIDYKTISHRAAGAWGDSGTAEVSPYVLAQMTWYMGISRLPEAVVVALIGLDDLRIYRVPFDPELFEVLENRARDFWFNHVLANVAPTPETTEALKRAYPRDTLPQVLADDEARHAAVRLRQLKDEIKVLEETAEGYEVRIKQLMAEASLLVDPRSGEVLCTWKATKPIERIDVKRFKKDMPQLAREFTVTTTERRFLVK